MKNIEWVISEIEQRVENVEDHEKTAAYNKGVARGLEISLFLIDQRDEPDVTHEQVVEWIENNDFYCHATAETVLENAVDKGKLSYYGTKYSVVKVEEGKNE